MTEGIITGNQSNKRGDLGWKIWTISNLLSLSRVFLLVPIFIFLRRGTEQNGNEWAVIFMGIAALTDYLDGASARWLNQRSQLGRILDPLSDKVCLLSIGIFLALPMRTYPIPWWFLGLTVLRDLLILVGTFYILGRFQHIPRSMTVGKWTSCFLALMLISYTLEWMPSSRWLFLFRMDVLLWISTVMVLLSGIVYARRTIKGHFPGEEMIHAEPEMNLAKDREVVQ